jgi:transposase
MREDGTVPSPLGDQRRDVMKAPDEVSAMLRLKALGWGSKRIAAELGCSRNTVRHWLARSDWRPCASRSRSRKLDGMSDWLRERFRQHAGNADVVRQELAREKNITVSLRTVERGVAPLRRELIAAARATVRFETQPGEQLQIDFGERRVEVDGVAVKVFLFVATLGYSRRLRMSAPTAMRGRKAGSTVWRVRSVPSAGCHARFCSTTPRR